MALTFNIRHLENKELQLAGQLPLEELELDLNDEVILPSGPLEYDLNAQELDDALLVQGTLRLPLDMHCVRCLKKFSYPLELEDWTCHLPLTGEDAVVLEGDLVNLTPQIREDILLALPQHPLCEEGCVGLRKPAAFQEEPGETSVTTSSAWDELDKLKL